MAALARLGVTDEEAKTAAKDLQGILDHFSKIQAIDTTDVPMANDASGLENVSRKDVAEADVLCAGEDLLAAVPETKDGQIKVKAVFD